MRSSYKKEDVVLLLKDITGLVKPQPASERERLIQSGKHYCEMLPIEYVPSEKYMQAYEEALEVFAEPTARAVEVLAEKIKRFCPEAEILCYASGEKLLLAEKAPDIVFLDIQMPGTDGMETAGVLRKRHKRMILIFVTAMEDYVFRAFDVGAFHYLVKPFSQQKFEAVLLGALEQYREFAQAPEGGRGQEEEKGIMILSGGSHIKVCLQDIIYAEVFNRKVVIHKMAEDMEYYGKLSDLEKLAGEDFFRPHRSYLVNFRYVVKYDAAEIALEKGTVPMAKKKYPSFVKSYLQYNRRIWSEGRI